MSHLLRAHFQCEYNHLLIIKAGPSQIISRAIMVYLAVVSREMLRSSLFSNELLRLPHSIALQLFQHYRLPRSLLQILHSEKLSVIHSTMVLKKDSKWHTRGRMLSINKSQIMTR